MRCDRPQASCPKDFYPVNDRPFPQIGQRDHTGAAAASPGEIHQFDHAAHRVDLPVQAEFPNEQDILYRLMPTNLRRLPKVSA
jgi:hypothetical protein